MVSVSNFLVHLYSPNKIHEDVFFGTRMRIDGFRPLVWCLREKAIILEFKKNGKANNTLLALNVFLTVLTLTEVLANSRAKLLRFFAFKDDADLVFTAAILPLQPSVGRFIQRVL